MEPGSPMGLAPPRGRNQGPSAHREYQGLRCKDKYAILSHFLEKTPLCRTRSGDGPLHAPCKVAIFQRFFHTEKIIGPGTKTAKGKPFNGGVGFLLCQVPDHAPCLQHIPLETNSRAVTACEVPRFRSGLRNPQPVSMARLHEPAAVYRSRY